uniref:ubiquitinyl hydrolase 1 n=1 Tax=Hucho hucho TaxID=62062 RepID=A0A4W5KHY7_9TELE
MCHRCKKRQKSTKKFWVQKLPKVLCLHLKRFHWTSYLRNKITTYVEFPLRGLDMRGYLLQGWIGTLHSIWQTGGSLVPLQRQHSDSD